MREKNKTSLYFDAPTYKPNKEDHQVHHDNHSLGISVSLKTEIKILKYKILD